MREEAEGEVDGLSEGLEEGNLSLSDAGIGHVSVLGSGEDLPLALVEGKDP